MATFKVTSSAFEPGKPIPSVCAYKGAGQNQSCPVSWSGAPDGTKSFVLIVDDPDAPSPRHPRAKPWVHWVLYDIPSETTSLGQGQSVGLVGRNDFGETKWGGPLPPPGSGRHRYFFKVYALDKMLHLSAGASKDQVIAAMKGHVVAQGELVGTYER
ncbi:MAG: YbhB/YbcL family Raf kinase inhibitor-like protein [Deltaproteobacteria bacterium]|nr:YbhB/YbcL family Raf kinase inhibitor-like protein [Deltaproteobacteria bacterium]